MYDEVSYDTGAGRFFFDETTNLELVKKASPHPCHSILLARTL